ncbi:TPA: restriction endonuclease subunit S [Staphylococcus aureus]|uniref:restriction endonuclease subunit S n=5 Tax=Bacilli TaxID=91061 RepID=UPI0005C26CE4|nr:restriction endonuclease subunit S [Staphylococcus aureus]AJP21652.1 restriction endonuclease subunit S [Staphylococcus aureus]ATZ15835.1 restriction endonuclease subunit S [Staphylococcus aureus]EJX2103543.1 restriction endonuclease subunit S [Staphylococcus aureus]EKF1404705.1 restriction endonuclease subunit S [Staphylococcus aureus]MBB2532376.1 restriction endonuclease subunit S [Staphylococcus aureus]
MSNTQKKNVPELRFPGFEGEWEEKKLGDITDRLIRKNKNLESKKPLTISGQLGLIDQTEYFSKSVSSKNLENYTLIKNGEFAYNKSYSNGYPLGAIKRLTRYDSGVLSSLYICFSIKSEMSKDFMEAYFDSTHWYREVSGIAVEGARNHGLLNISVNDFFTILIKYPSLEEQRKIGDFFIKLDRQIELEEQKLELLQQQKKGYMQKIFSQELRFKDENGNDYPEWEEKKLGELGLFQKSYSFSRAKEGNGKTKHIHYGDIHSKFKTVLDSDGNIPNIIEEAVFELVQKGDIIFADASEDYSDLGKAVMIDFEPNSLISGLHTHLFRPFNNVISNFLIFYTKTLSYKKFIRQQGTGISVLGISKKSLLNLDVLIPQNELEQQKIGQFFSKIDRQIELEQQKLELLQQQKKSLLQSMFI